jgi:hypothetical protein
MSQIDLDDKKLLDYGDGTPFLPFESGQYKGKLLSVIYKQGYESNAYLFKFECLESDNQSVRVGSEFCLRFAVSGTVHPALVEANKKRMRNLLATIYDAAHEDPKFEASKKMSELIGLGESAADLDCVLKINASCRKVVPKKGDKAGQVVDRTNFSWSKAA